MGLGFKTFVRERLTADDVNGYLMGQVTPQFDSAAQRDTVLAAPVDGMTCYLRDVKAFEERVNGAWRRRSGRSSTAFSAGTLAATNNTTIGTLVVNPGRPYRVHVHAAGGFVVGTGGVGNLRLFDSGQAGVIRAQDPLTVSKTAADVSRWFDVTDGASHTYTANLEVTAGSIQYFADERASYLEARWEAL